MPMTWSQVNRMLGKLGGSRTMIFDRMLGDEMRELPDQYVDSFSVTVPTLPVPQKPRVKATLGNDDAKRYESERLGALGRLAFSPGCRKFLSDHHIDIKALMDAVRNQRPFDGTKSTISRASAGLVNPDDPTDVRLGGVEVRIAFGSRGGTNAETAMYPGGGRVGSTTVYDRSDVKRVAAFDVEWFAAFQFQIAWVGRGFGTILHEALHSLLGETDTQIQARFGLGTTGLTGTITEELRKHGCAE